MNNDYTELEVYYFVENTLTDIQLWNDADNIQNRPTRMIVDGVETDITNIIRFSAKGVHSVKYEFSPIGCHSCLTNDFCKNNNYVINVVVGSEVEYIPKNIFKNCKNLKNVYCLSTTPPILVGRPFEKNVIFYVPSESVGEYKEKWLDYSNNICKIN